MIVRRVVSKSISLNRRTGALVVRCVGRKVDESLRENLCEAVAICCWYDNNRLSFGKEGVVIPLVGFLRTTKNARVQTATARALHQLSKCAENCITIHHAGAVRVRHCSLTSQSAHILLVLFNGITRCGERADGDIPAGIWLGGMLLHF